METRRALAILDDHQAGLLALTSRLTPLLDDCPDQARTPLAHGRWEMLRRMRAYQIFKHTEIFEPLFLSGSAEQKRIAGRMRDRCLRTGEAYVDHTGRWSMTDVVAEWDSYRPAARVMLDGLLRHMAEEKSDIVALLAAIPRLRCRLVPAKPAPQPFCDAANR